MTPVVLRHPNATRQSVLMGVIAVSTALMTVLLLVAGQGWLKAIALIMGIPAVFFTYMCMRTATLRVQLDDEGVWEPDPFRLTFVTPWDQIRQIRPSLSSGRVRFVGVQLVYMDGEERDIVALKMQAGAAGSEDAVATWVEAIRNAKRAARA